MKFVSSISGLPISAGSAAYAPTNGADVSAVASAYAESAASGKLDSTASSQFITSTADLATTAYVDSSVSSKLDTTAFSTVSSNFLTSQTVTALGDDGTYITSINGSGISGVGGGGATGDYVETSATEVTIGSDNSASATSFAQGKFNSASGVSFAQGIENTAAINSFAQGVSNTASGRSFALGGTTKATVNSFALGEYNIASSNSFAQGQYNTASSNSFAQGTYNSANDFSFVQGYLNTTDHSFAQGAFNSAATESFAQGNANTASVHSFAQGVGNSANNYSFAQGRENSASSYSFAHGIENSAINTAAVFGLYNLHGNGDISTGDSAAFVIGDGENNVKRHDLMLVTKDGEITMYSSTADTAGTGIMSSIRAISAAATGGGVDSATVSAIASSYAESAVSSVSSNYLGTGESSNYYPTGNPSGFALSSDVSGTVDLVSAQSANWSTNADWEQTATSSPSYIENKPDLVDIVAGPGIVVDNPDGNTLRVSTEADAETVLYTGTNNTSPVALSEAASNFEYIEITWEHNYNNAIINHPVFKYRPDSNEVMAYGGRLAGSGFVWFIAGWTFNSGKTELSRTQSKYITITTSVGTPADNNNLFPVKVVGIHRTASN